MRSRPAAGKPDRMSDAATLDPTATQNDEQPATAATGVDFSTEDAIVETARHAVSQCNWVIGQCAAEWTQRYAAGRTDGDFGELVGLSADQVYQRRRVWETFADVRTEYAQLRWSHFYAAVTWDDAPDALSWSEEMGATVAEMRAWRRGQRGEDLTQPAEPDELPPFEPTSVLQPTTTHIASFDDADGEAASGGGSASGERSEESSMALARQTGESEYAPYGADARGDGSEAAAKDDDTPLRPLAEFKKVAKALERLNEQLSAPLLATFYEIPGDVQDRVNEAFDDVQTKLAGLR